jgi:hypothetical protein
MPIVDTHASTSRAAVAKALPPLEQLRRLRANIEIAAHGLSTRYRSLYWRAEVHARALEPGRGSSHGRDATTWTKRQEAWFQAELRRLVEVEKRDLLAQIARYDRLRAAEAAIVRRLRVNEPWVVAWQARLGEPWLRDLLRGEPLPRFAVG